MTPDLTPSHSSPNPKTHTHADQAPLFPVTSVSLRSLLAVERFKVPGMENRAMEMFGH